MSIHEDVDQFLGGSSGPSGFKKDDPIGTTVRGTVEAAEVRQQRDIQTGEPKVWKDGNPMMQLVITLATDQRDPSVEGDDGTRRLFAKGDMLNAIRDALRKSGAKRLEVGGKLAVQRTGQGQPAAVGFNPPWLHRAQYEPPVGRPVGFDVDELL